MKSYRSPMPKNAGIPKCGIPKRCFRMKSPNLSYTRSPSRTKLTSVKVKAPKMSSPSNVGRAKLTSVKVKAPKMYSPSNVGRAKLTSVKVKAPKMYSGVKKFNSTRFKTASIKKLQKALWRNSKKTKQELI